MNGQINTAKENESKFEFQLAYLDKKENKSIKGEMFGTGAEQVILKLLEQYPDCKGTVKRVSA